MKILVRRRELERRYPKTAVLNLMGGQPYENIIDAVRMVDGHWRINPPRSSEIHLEAQDGHEMVTILINVEELQKDPSFPPAHPIWKLPVVQRDFVAGKGPPEIEANAVAFPGYFRIDLPNTTTTFVHEHQVGWVKD
jgi:hypothetical protein